MRILPRIERKMCTFHYHMWPTHRRDKEFLPRGCDMLLHKFAHRSGHSCQKEFNKGICSFDQSLNVMRSTTLNYSIFISPRTHPQFNSQQSTRRHICRALSRDLMNPQSLDIISLRKTFRLIPQKTMRERNTLQEASSLI